MWHTRMNGLWKLISLSLNLSRQWMNYKIALEDYTILTSLISSGRKWWIQNKSNMSQQSRWTFNDNHKTIKRSYKTLPAKCHHCTSLLSVSHTRSAHKITTKPRNVWTKAPMTIMAICILVSNLSINGLMNPSNLNGMKSAVLDPKARIRTDRTRNINTRNARKHSLRQQSPN